MMWLDSMSASTASCSGTYTAGSSTAANADAYTLQWTGIKHSFFDGYEGTGEEEAAVYTVETGEWPFRVEWGSEAKTWIHVTANTDTPSRNYYFYYRWNGEYPSGYPDYDSLDSMTGNFAPLAEELEIAPETFMKWLEQIGHDESMLRQSYRMQKEMMKATGQLPPWDPRKVEQMEEARRHLAERMQELEEAERVKMEEKLMERWGITEIPEITPDLLDSIEASSRGFLDECLSPQERRFFDEHGHIKLESREQPNVVYVIKKKPRAMIERHIDGKHVDNICYQSKWTGLPANDILAMKVLDVKYNEAEVLKVGNLFKAH